MLWQMENNIMMICSYWPVSNVAMRIANGARGLEFNFGAGQIGNSVAQALSRGDGLRHSLHVAT